MIKNIRHSGIVVKDLESSLNFYQNVLGFKIHKQMEESGDFIDNILALQGASLTTIKMHAPDGQMIELLYYHSHQREKRKREICEIGLTHLAFSVENLSVSYQKLSELGVEFLSEPKISPGSFAKVAFCVAPEGTFIELVEELKHA